MITAIDHVAIPMASTNAILVFYRGPGFEISEDYGARVFAIHCGYNKIDLHTPELWQLDKFSLRGQNALPDCGDFCFVWSGSEEALHEASKAKNRLSKRALLNVRVRAVMARILAQIFIQGILITIYSNLFSTRRECPRSESR